MSIFWTILLILFAIFVLFVVIFLFLDVNVIITLNKPKGEKALLEASVVLPGGKSIYEKKIGSKANEQKDNSDNDPDESFKETLAKLLASFVALKAIYRDHRQKRKKLINVEKLFINASFGTDDAFKTAMTAGSVWTSIFGVVAFLSTFTVVTEPKISITPDFDEEYIEAEGECILKFRVYTLFSLLMTITAAYNKINEKVNDKNIKNEKAAINYGGKSN